MYGEGAGDTPAPFLLGRPRSSNRLTGHPLHGNNFTFRAFPAIR